MTYEMGSIPPLENTEGRGFANEGANYETQHRAV